jgi:mannosylglycerate hydrolase
LKVHVISHTHWDREWYYPAVRFRQRLVALVDELLNDPPQGGRSFLLDGQTVVLDDYLSVRPDRTAEVATLLRTGALEAGPWFVLADELIPSGEALVRNLLAGRRGMRALRSSAPAVLYCPDSFGHPGALPTLATGFGCSIIVLWRGYGSRRWPEGDSAWWQAPNGDRVLLHHLSRDGYSVGENLPTTPDAARERWGKISNDLLSRNRVGVVVLLNGADHHARQKDLDAALSALANVADSVSLASSSLRAFAEELLESAATKSLSEVRGELRDSYGYTWTLGGTLAARAHQKRRNALIERKLIREAEPWAALAAARGGEMRTELLHAAWRSLLLCHPHDTLCGCSTDEVARAMDARLDEADSQATGIREDALLDLIGYDADEARMRQADWRQVVVVSNPCARPRSGFALLTLTRFIAHVPVGPGSGARQPTLAEQGSVVPALRAGDAASPPALQVLERSITHERTESPRHYPDNDLVEVTRVAAWLPRVGGYGVGLFEQGTTAEWGTPRATPLPAPSTVAGSIVSNGILSLRIEGDGVVSLHDLETGRTIDNLLHWNTVTDLGDLYTPSPREPNLVPHFEGSRVTASGPLRSAIELHWALWSGREEVRVFTRLVLDAGARHLRIEIGGDNRSEDHRLQLAIVTDFGRAAVVTTVADAMFGPVERAPIVVDEEDARMEQPTKGAPLHRYVSIFEGDRGATLFSDGLAEYEMGKGEFEDSPAEIAVTLFRAVGELSRANLPERPGHAGWPTPTPEAQCQGPFEATLALLLHGPRSAEVTTLVEATADDVLLPLAGHTLRSAIDVHGFDRGIELEGAGLAFSTAKVSDDGHSLVLRCVNLLDESVDGKWRLGFTLEQAWIGRLDETTVEPVAVDGDTIPFRAGPRAVITIIVPIR